MQSPLADVTVVEVDSWMASPSAAAILADLGATVIKVEPLEGDPMRGGSRPPKGRDDVKGYDFQFDVDNRGKQSIAVALDKPEGGELVRRLVAGAQVFMCNLLPQRQQKFGLDPASLQRVNARLVHATLTGYGSTGPDATRPGYDVTAFFGRSGLYDAMREGTDGTVPMARPAQGDHTTGIAFAMAILAALRHAERTGEPQVVETSLYETAIWTQATDFATTAVDGAEVRRRARHEMLSITANRFPCGDGKWVVFNMPQPTAFPRFCRALGHPEWSEDERFVDPGKRYRNMNALVGLVDAALSVRSRDEWAPIFDEAGLIWGPVLALHEVVADRQAAALGMFPSLSHPSIGSYRSVSVPMRFATADVRPRGPSPGIGQHTRALLAGVGLGAGEVDALIAAGVVAEGGASGKPRG